MKKLYTYFKVYADSDSLHTDKRRVLVNTIIAFILVIFAFAIFRITITNTTNIAIFIALAVLLLFLVSVLFLQRWQSYSLAGNTFSIGVVAGIAAMMTSLCNPTSAISDYIEGLYYLISLLSFSVLFATKRVLLINSGIILVSAWFVYLSIEVGDMDIELMRKRGIINYTISLSFTTVALYLSMRFFTKSERIIADNLKRITTKNKEHTNLLQTVKNSVGTQREYAKAMQISANELSQHAMDQASSVEEVSATIEELLTSVILNTESTGKTKNYVEQSNHIVESGVESLQELVLLANQIFKKISVVQGIANKTSILAINASIEAAHAGEHGKGFSTVANEVRKLAAGSKQSAQDIMSLIRQSQQASEATQKNMQRISTGVSNVLDAIQKLAYAANEQERSFDQISSAINSINEHAQNNAHLSEQIKGIATNLLKSAEDSDKAFD